VVFLEGRLFSVLSSQFSDVIVVLPPKNVITLTSQGFSTLGLSQSKFLAAPVLESVCVNCQTSERFIFQTAAIIDKLVVNIFICDSYWSSDILKVEGSLAE